MQGQMIIEVIVELRETIKQTFTLIKQTFNLF